MNITRLKRSFFTRRWLLGSTALGILSSPAATVTWTGGGADMNFSTPANWTPGTPADGDELVFPDGASAFDVALNGTFSPAKLTFSSTGFTDYALDGTGKLDGTGVVIAKTGSSFLTLGGDNSFTGEIQVSSGKLALSSQNLIESTSYALGAMNNAIKVASGATLDFNGQGGAVHATAGSRRYYSAEVAGNGIEVEPGIFAGAITSSSSGNLAFVGRGKTGIQHLALTSDASVGVPVGVNLDLGFGSTGFVSGSVTSSSATVRTLTKTGAGTLHLAGTNSGVNVRVSEGILVGYSTTAFGNKLTIDAGAAARSWTTGTFTVPVEIGEGGTLTNASSPITFSGPITLTGTPTFSTNNTQPLTISSTLDAPADVVVHRTPGQAGSTVIFTADNTLDGELLCSGDAVVQLGSGGTTGSFKDDLGADSPVDLGSAGTLILNRSDSFAYNAGIAGTGTFQKTGSGTVRRTVPADFSRPGSTVGTVSAGTLLLNNASGQGLGEGSVSVSASATLGGTGSVAGVVFLGTGSVAAARAVVAPGDGALTTGTFTTGGLHIPSAASGSIQLEVDGTSADKLVVNGDIVLSPAKIAEIAVAPFGSGATQSSYTLLEYIGTLSGTFNSITGVPAGYRVRHDVPNKRIVLEQSAESTAFPQVMYFDGTAADILTNGDGAAAVAAGTWNTTLLNWDQGAVAHLPWVNNGSATGILAVGAYTVTVDSPAPLSVAGIKRMGAATASATLVTGGTLSLQPAAVLHEGHVGTSEQGLRIASKLTGTGGFTVSGRAISGANISRVTLLNPVSGDNTITGPVAINGGHLRLAASEQLGNSTVITANTMISNATATLETASSTNETIAGLNFGANGGELKLGGSGVSILTLDGGGLSIANAATFTYGNSASGIRFANAGEFVKSGDSSTTVTRVNAPTSSTSAAVPARSG
ncbi:autotransporter-associated beta strand repeat-containing protein [Luteolibacter arcticus]|uniref:Autotransporter-associated beta strand repeat-containing protein n=1 Tax=Luteolibacter arcticus TaxID=1581411 RepID=A0ABT3GDE9_9BACT|nr:autotransporter-associated beta strand repeat-containing protein [Luteolibacter arcticus]MCW1921471.1 autotransporter-associated beta strand repeat-containing protein [Luteolibacter arcticus]